MAQVNYVLIECPFNPESPFFIVAFHGREVDVDFASRPDPFDFAAKEAADQRAQERQLQVA